MSFTELQLDVDIDPARFTVPDIARDGVVEWCHVEPPDQVPRLSPSAPEFTVAWWPTGALSHPDRGDPTVPELLLVLTTLEHAPRFFLGVAPAGGRARTVPGCAVRRWRTPEWDFALSWRGDVIPADIDRVIASVPEQW